MKHLKKKALCLFMLLVIALSSVQIGAATEGLPLVPEPEYELRFDNEVLTIYKDSGDPAEVRYAQSPDYTPNGTVFRYYVYYKETLEKVPLTAVLDNKADAISSTAYRHYSANPNSNGHGYAWKVQDADDSIFWIPDPSVYYSSADQSYSEVSTPAVGDIICYYNAAGKILHSGIIVGTTATSTGLASKYIVESKWGPYGVYRHNGYQCPYTAFYGGPAKTVKFYRRNGHTHSFTKYTATGDLCYHIEQCSICGLKVHQPHVWTKANVKPASVDDTNALVQFFCTDCGEMALQPPTPKI